MEFTCRLGTPDGRVEVQTFDAADESSLRVELEKRGLHVFTIRHRGLALGLPAMGGRRRAKKVGTEAFMIFNQELAALLRAGLPLLQGLDMMLERMADLGFKAVLTEIRDRVRSGEELSEAFAGFGDLFPRLYAPTLKAGERSGELEQVIRRFVRYQRLVLEARKKAVSALVYPVVLVGLSIAMILVLTFFVVPRFSGFFTDVGADLPLVTRVVLGASSFAGRTTLGVANGLWIVLALAAGVLALRAWSRTPAGSEAVDRIKLRLPLIGPVLKLFALSEFCRSLATLLTGGMPLVPAFEIAVRAVGNLSVRNALEPQIQLVREGRPFHGSLEESAVFPPMAIDMVKVGEATGSLDEMLGNVSTFFDERVETHLQRILALVEPMMLVFMGLIIGLLLVSIYLPLFGAIGKVS
jgi:type IV pilus assembly protein PilC